jgi:hypothetical protein
MGRNYRKCCTYNIVLDIIDVESAQKKDEEEIVFLCALA